MLILSRRVGETIKIGEDIEVTVLGIKGNQLKLGVAAPKNVSIVREELMRRRSIPRPAASLPAELGGLAFG